MNYNYDFEKLKKKVDDDNFTTQDFTVFESKLRNGKEFNWNEMHQYIRIIMNDTHGNHFGEKIATELRRYLELYPDYCFFNALYDALLKDDNLQL